LPQPLMRALGVLAISHLDDAELQRRALIVVEQYDGIWAPAVAFYSRSVRYAVTRANAAFVRYDDLRCANEPAEEQVSAVHEALGHASAASRFFFPPGAKNKSLKKLQNARAQKLRGIFEVSHESPLKNRELRNFLEHFEENLDEYILLNDSGMFFTDAMVGEATLADESSGNVFKLVDPIAEVFVVLGTKFNFGPLRSEIERLYARVA